MPSDLVMTIEALQAELCSISDLGTRTERCRDLYSEDLPAEQRALLLHFWSDGLYHLHQYYEAINRAAVGIGFATGPRLASILAVQAGAFYEVAQLDDLQRCVGRLLEMEEAAPATRAYGLALRAVAIGLSGATGWQAAFREAECSLIAVDGMEGNLAWLQDSAATCALSKGELPAALEWAERISHPEWEAGARLLRAEAYIRLGMTNLAEGLMCAPDETERRPIDRARYHLLESLLAHYGGRREAAHHSLIQAEHQLMRAKFGGPGVALMDRIGALRAQIDQEGGE